MKKLIFISFLVLVFSTLTGYSQTNNSTGPEPDFNSKLGLINITEVNIGKGIYQLHRDFAKRVFNLTSICGIGLTRHLTGGIGIGVSLYDGGTLIPLFADFRYFTNIGKTRVFVFGEGGILLNSAKTVGGTKYLVSPGVGVVLPISNNLSASLGAGLITQLMKDFDHDSFVNIKLGMIYLFNGKRN